jgi:hypothetical protein
MSEFEDKRDELSARRRERDDAAAELALRREQLRDAEYEAAALRRTPGDEHKERLEALENEIATLREDVGGLRDHFRGLHSGATDLIGELVELADPAAQAAELDDGRPILLFPVRLETRFHGDELWIRIYPDDVQIDAFEDLLTKTEVDNAREFWIAMWRAGGFEPQERGAWRALAGGSGSGRAAYVISQYRPAVTPPAKVDAQDVVLVIVPEIAVTDLEREKAFDYYEAVWKAGNDATARATAAQTFETAVGAARAEEIRTGFAPEPGGQEPPIPYTRAGVRVGCQVLELPATPPTKTTTWTQAPRAAALPDRFVALLWGRGATGPRSVVGNAIPDRLAVGPDPSLPEDEQIHADGDDLAINDDLRWLTDFDRAVTVGMGIRVHLSAAEAGEGFDRLVVLGLRCSSDPQESRERLQTLIEHHHAGSNGFSLVPQGSPTNNSGEDGAAYTWLDDPDAAYDIVFKGTEAYPDTTDPLQRRDGQWLAEALGIDGELLKRVPNAAGRDQAEARAMQTALWPATLGYALEDMLRPVVDAADIAATRQFFTHFVSGRGPLPAVRVGRQPYGILPAMAFARYRESGPVIDFAAGPRRGYLQRLHAVLAQLDGTWHDLSADVAHVGNPGNPHQTLLDIVGLHSGSVEFHQRYAESFAQLYNMLVLQLGPAFGTFLAEWLRTRGEAMLRALGADWEVRPPILDKFFFGKSPRLTGPLVDDVPLSETERVRAYAADGRNYIAWLATSSLEQIRVQDFGGQPAPTALLYLLARHAMMLCNWDAGIRLLEGRELVDSALVRREPEFIHVADGELSESRFQRLYEPWPEITGDDLTTLAEYVRFPAVLAEADETSELRAVVAALEALRDVPTARLERLLSEHVDCCGYRLDAWKTGLVHTRLQELRGHVKGGGGLYLGAYGWLEDLEPKPAPEPVTSLDPELAAVFARPGDAPLAHDTANAGFIHAPSLNHAGAAAILKNAYRVNATPANPDAMAVNLSSRRVRLALDVLEGMRNGQPLAALLGYRFERGLHDAHGLAEVDKFIYPLRQVFPLASGQLASTQPPDPTDVTLLEARNVLDGAALVARRREPGKASYPFGVPIGDGPGKVPAATATEQAAINATADAMADLHDAVADLVLAESVYQVVLGNFDRAAANTAAYSAGSRPPETFVVDTPRSGLSLTHRVALHLDPDAIPAVSPSAVAMTARSRAEAPLNLWLAARLPAPGDVVVRVTYTTPALAAPKTVTVTAAALGFQPVDLLYVVDLELEAAMTELDDRILQAVRYGADAHPDMAVTIEYTQPVAGKVTFFELAALLRSLRPLLLQSRALGPADMARPLEATADESVWEVQELADRVTAAIGELTARRDELTALVADASDLDVYARKVSVAFLAAARHGLPGLGTGEIHGDIRAIYDAIVDKARELVERWEGKHTAYTTLLAAYPGLTTNPERFALLVEVEGQIAASTTAVPDPDPDVYRTDIAATKTVFDGVRGQFDALLTLATGKLVDFAAAAAPLRAAAAVHDATPFDIDDQLAAMPTLRATLVARVEAAEADFTERIDAATAAVAAATTVPELLAAAKDVLGDEIVLVPRFRLGGDRGLEVEHCVNGSAALLTDLRAAGRRFPVEDWLYGIARVRGKLGALENVAVLSEGFGAPRLELTPLQLPRVQDDRWMALDFDASEASGDHLLYTAHFAVPFDRAADQCGLLLDEWPELVPADDVVSGVTFNFDAPSSQPPQVMLLAVTPQVTGSWSWDDLVAMLPDTLGAARSRAVEPAHIDATAYAQFLPATLMAVTLYQITIATNLLINNDIYAHIE